MISPPQRDEPTDELWRKVVELTTIVNALSALTVTGAVKGKVVISGGVAVLVTEPK
jgi:hypothetical protein